MGVQKYSQQTIDWILCCRNIPERIPTLMDLKTILHNQRPQVFLSLRWAFIQSVHLDNLEFGDNWDAAQREEVGEDLGIDAYWTQWFHLIFRDSFEKVSRSYLGEFYNSYIRQTAETIFVYGCIQPDLVDSTRSKVVTLK